MEGRARLSNVLVALILIATVAFAIGAAIEKSKHHSESRPRAAGASGISIVVDGQRATLVSETAAQHAAESGGTTTQTPAATGTSTESKAAHRNDAQHKGEGSQSETAAQHANETHSEKLLGLDPEATGLVVVAVISSLLLAAAVWLRPDHALLLLVVPAAMLLFAALDIREAIHQSDESNDGLVILASVIAALHLSAGILAANLSRLRWSSASPA